MAGLDGAQRCRGWVVEGTILHPHPVKRTHLLLALLLHLKPCAQVDTLVMQNLGYFQLKASPGLWELSIAAGRSRDLYQIVSATSGSALSTGFGWGRKHAAAGHELADAAGKDYATQVLMHSFTGATW